ncbi:PREDICTED: plasmolipin-like [Priapulus caudatus]|uniref:Plasmolipin-like n=1 Tax=Priapulus caudatus TaxID=37621 RepID=A0ABM1F6X7_PRICU|nr:PREDICTED: plasmolipin-like [Priapulus caudatus]
MSTTQQATVTTTTTTTTKPYFDPSYLRTVPGILKCLQLVLNAICFICCVARWSGIGGGRIDFYFFCCIVGFIVTLILLILYLFHVVGYFYKLPWYLIEFIYCAVWTLFYLSASIAMADLAGKFSNTFRRYYSALAAAAFFGFLAMIAYGVDAFFKFRAWRNGEKPQIIAQQTSTRTTATVESPH